MDNQEQQEPQVYIYQNCAKWMKNGPWYNTAIFSQLSDNNFEDYFKTRHTDRYAWMCAVNEYDIMNTSRPVNGISGGGRKFTTTSYKDAFESLVQEINLIDNRLQCFEENDV